MAQGEGSHPLTLSLKQGGLNISHFIIQTVGEELDGCSGN